MWASYHSSRVVRVPLLSATRRTASLVYRLHLLAGARLQESPAAMQFARVANRIYKHNNAVYDL